MDAVGARSPWLGWFDTFCRPVERAVKINPTRACVTNPTTAELYER